MAGQNGGGAFILLYLGMVVTIGLSVMLAELAIGRASQKNPVGAFAKLKGGAWPIVGYLGVAAGFIILSFYSVVGGWTIAYVIKTATGLLTQGTAEELGIAFGGFISDPGMPLVYHAIFMVLTVAVVMGGIGNGIERACKVLMPALFILLIILVFRSLTLPGGAEGLIRFLTPDFSKVDGGMINAALSQAFFSLSLGLGAMITYGSYISRMTNLPGAALWVTCLDSLVAILAAAIVLPAVFAFNFDPAAGPSLTFITLPAVFSQMPFGTIFGSLFFILLTIAALTSSVSLMEVVIAYFVDEKGFCRKKAALLFGFLIFLLGIPSSLSLGIWSGYQVAGKNFFDMMDYLTSNLIMPIGGIGISLFVGWVIFDVAEKELTSDGYYNFPLMGLWRFICRYVAPIAIGWILVTGL